MKKTSAIIFGLVIVVSGFSQELVRNPAKPLNPLAGRILKLEPVFEISDVSGKFFFKWPSRLQLDDTGFLYLLDDNQLLKFSAEGGFIRNFYKKGQGPGEIASRYQMVSYLSFHDGLYVYDGRTKIIHFDGEGKLLGEVKQTAGDFIELLGISENGYFTRSQTNVPWEGAAAKKMRYVEWGSSWDQW